MSMRRLTDVDLSNMRPIITDWLEQDGLAEDIAIQIASDGGVVWSTLSEDEKTTYRDGADSIIILISEWEGGADE